MNKFFEKLWTSQEKRRHYDFDFFFKNASSATKKDVFSRILETVNKEQQDIVRRYGK